MSGALLSVGICRAVHPPLIARSLERSTDMPLVSTNRESIFVRYPDYTKPFSVYDVAGVPQMLRPPTADDVTVGVDGSTAENPRNLDESIDDKLDRLLGQRITGLHVARVDLPKPTRLSGAAMPAGLSFVASRSLSVFTGLRVWTERDHDTWRQAVRLWEEWSLRELLEHNGQDPDHPGWPRDSGFSHRNSAWTPYNTFRTIDPKWCGFPKAYSCRVIGQLEAPKNERTALLGSITSRETEERHQTEMLASIKEQREATLVQNEMMRTQNAALLALLSKHGIEVDKPTAKAKP